MQLWDSLALDQTIKKCFYDKITDTKKQKTTKIDEKWSHITWDMQHFYIFAQTSIACFENKPTLA